MDSDDLFNRLVRKQAGREMKSAGETEITDALKRRVYGLFKAVKEKGNETRESDLAPWQEFGMEIPVSCVLFAGFLRGIDFPLVDDPEISVSALGDFGTCLMAGPNLIGFRDKANGEVLLDNREGTGGDCPRFATFMAEMRKVLLNWEGVNLERDGNKEEYTFEGSWVGRAPKTLLEYFVRVAFENVSMHVDQERWEKLEFEIEMRKAFGNV